MLKRDHDSSSDFAASVVGGLAIPRHLGLYFTAALAMAAFVFTVLALPAGDSAMPTLVLGGLLIVLSAFDATTLRLPNLLTLAVLLAGIAFAPSAETGWRVASALVAGLSLVAIAEAYRALRGQHGLGYGDIKLFSAAGAWVGLEGLASIMLVACAAAFVFLAVRAAVDRSSNLHAPFAFGPFIAVGLWTVWLYGPVDRILFP